MTETKTKQLLKCPSCGSRGDFWYQASYDYPVCSEDCYFEMREAEIKEEERTSDKQGDRL